MYAIRFPECSFPANWRESSWMTNVVQQSKDILLINYNIDKSCSTTKSTTPKFKINKYNCPAYSQLVDGTQVYLRAEIGKQQKANGLCVEQKRLTNTLLRREAGTQSDIDSCKAALNGVDLYRILLPVDPNRPADAGFHYRTTWSVSTEINCPMTGIHSVICQTTGNDVCPPDSAVKVEGSRMTIYVPTLSKKYPNLPLTGSIKCLADIGAASLGEPNSNDRILALKWSTNSQPDRVHFYCVRYRRLANGTWSMSLDIQNTRQIECLRYAQHNWQGAHGTPPREYFKLLMIHNPVQSSGESTVIGLSVGAAILKPDTNPMLLKCDVTLHKRLVSLNWEITIGTSSGSYLSAQNTKSTTMPTKTTTTAMITTTTTMATTLPDRATLYHIQFMLGASYQDYVDVDEKVDPLKADLKSYFLKICHIRRDSLKVQLEKGKGGEIMTTFNVNDTKTSVESCKQNLIDNIKQGGTIRHDKMLIPVKKTVYLWEDDSTCPDIICKAGSRCWIRQGEYTCECSIGSQDATGVCSATNVLEQSADSNKRVITFAVIGAAAFLVVIAFVVIIIVVIRRRRDDKDIASDKDSIGSLEQQDRDMYSSIGKKPRAYHDKQFIVTDEDEYTGEKTGIQNSGYK
ncbi:hypothetical protein LSH36_145g03000 [Paralvinella palmiformis]|uniref:EGF-like domain-containing protein n=1 Tax=Paralvinella palmiformis TaxID=53620 RepID=A0AAD9N7L4_9ANNE|nr:hypothetical protein LSH36_145g03000 [Paralvinella palmiformis]